MGRVFGALIAILVTIASLAQGAEAFFSLVDRWKKKRLEDKTSDRKSGVEQESPRIPFRLTKRTVNWLMFNVPWYLLLVVQIGPVYQYLESFQDSIGATLTIVAYSSFWLVYPYLMRKTPHRIRLLFLIVVFILVDFTLASLSFYLPGFSEAEWYPWLVAVAHSVGFTGARLLIMIYYFLEYFNPWFNSLPEE